MSDKHQDAYTKKLRDNVIKLYGKEPATLDELAEAIIAIINNHNPRAWSTRSDKQNVPDKLNVLGFAWNISYNDKVSNSHSAPRSGKTNWGGRTEGAPSNYPGFQGRVWIRYDSNKDFGFGSDPFRETMSHTGTGGGGSYDGEWKAIASAHFKTYGHNRKSPILRPELFSWDYKIFLDDWPLSGPLIKELISKETDAMELRNTYKILANQPKEVFKLEHKYSWNDPATVLADEAFLKEFHLTYEGEK
jgi:hypothetical protein